MTSERIPPLALLGRCRHRPGLRNHTRLIHADPTHDVEVVRARAGIAAEEAKRGERDQASEHEQGGEYSHRPVYFGRGLYAEGITNCKAGEG